MLIEFSVTNFKSIKEKQTLDMRAAKLKEPLVYNVAELQQQNEKLPNLLKSLVVYGANAAGKSNLLKALAAMNDFVVKSHSGQDGDPIKEAVPFLFNTETRAKPSEFEVLFLSDDDIVYRYGFIVDNEKILREWLFSYSFSPDIKKTFPRCLFERIYNPNKSDEDKKCEWIFKGGHLKGEKKTWIGNTRINSLFLSAAIQNGNEQLKPVFGWFKFKLQVMVNDVEIGFTVKQCEDKTKKDKILELLKVADPAICGIKIEEKKIAIDDKEFQVLPNFIKELAIKKQANGVVRTAIYFSHNDNEQKEIYLNINDESDGTQKMFSLVGPLLDIIENGRILVIDELDSSLHPLLVRGLIEIFHNPQINKKNAQLIFSTHDVSVLDKDIFRRDQIWFVEKNDENATNLYSLVDFKVRKGILIAKGYLKGLYGGIPYEKVWANFARD